MCFVIVGECTVKWILLRRKFYRDIITSTGRVRIIETAVVSGPLFIPRTCVIRDEIMSAWLFADPKDGGYNICFPWIRPRTPRVRRFAFGGFIFVGDRLDLSEGRIKSD
jgi:hypothetical protein